ncbi:hypothetical protein E2C01_016857 [Portunus trituberculatus]|uniref:Uncharacterized protein n=1 Tax=Portunus trituberculatus TaxID=210409 RepID=A0A5B7DQ69_PORTR|nr:hypothetical protein [Portunus trituberculatus]
MLFATLITSYFLTLTPFSLSLCLAADWKRARRARPSVSAECSTMTCLYPSSFSSLTHTSAW